MDALVFAEYLELRQEIVEAYPENPYTQAHIDACAAERAAKVIDALNDTKLGAINTIHDIALPAAERQDILDKIKSLFDVRLEQKETELKAAKQEVERRHGYTHAVPTFEPYAAHRPEYLGQRQIFLQSDQAKERRDLSQRQHGQIRAKFLNGREVVLAKPLVKRSPEQDQKPKQMLHKRGSKKLEPIRQHTPPLKFRRHFKANRTTQQEFAALAKPLQPPALDQVKVTETWDQYLDRKVKEAQEQDRGLEQDIQRGPTLGYGR